MIKSDRWIIRLAKEKGLIEPFEAAQVKVAQTSAGPSPVISYGVSSYSATTSAWPADIQSAGSATI